jgi:hypothetical protein
MFNLRRLSDIRVRLSNGQWVQARPYQEEAFTEFSNRQTNYLENPIAYDKIIDGERYKFTIQREPNQGIYLIREDETKMPIVDWNNVQVFLIDLTPVDWYNAWDYQIWAYFDFIYSQDIERYYMSIGSTNIDFTKRYITIPNTPTSILQPNIVFRISRNENGTIFYERNDVGRTRVRISDNPRHRSSYSAFYGRMTEPLFPIIVNPVTNAQSITCASIPAGVIITETLNDDEMCVVCNFNRQNIRFLPCQHTNTCSECCKELLKNASSYNPISCPMCRGKITQIITYTPPSQKHFLHPVSTNWFECAFGFTEQSYANTKAQFQKMLAEENNTHLNGIQIGKFELFNTQQLNTKLQTILVSGHVALENIVRNIIDVHQNPTESSNATIQVASQFNCLEMANPIATPEIGITIYQFDRTQGPVCAMATPAGLAYRNYLYNGGQGGGNQVNMTTDLLRFLQTFDPTIIWGMQNGYLMFGSDEDLKKINRVLFSDPNIRRHARSLLQCASHSNQGVFIECKNYNHTVNHVYCSGLPIAYNNLQKDLWDGFAEIVLEAMYENTLLIACMNNAISGQNKPCYLTQIGGGVFGMKHAQIIRAIHRACNIIANRGLNLNVKIVHYGSINPLYNTIPQMYPIHMNNNTNMPSIWENNAWLQTAL